jgi:hypothetical protein
VRGRAQSSMAANRAPRNQRTELVGSGAAGLMRVGLGSGAAGPGSGARRGLVRPGLGSGARLIWCASIWRAG